MHFCYVLISICLIITFAVKGWLKIFSSNLSLKNNIPPILQFSTTLDAYLNKILTSWKILEILSSRIFFKWIINKIFSLMLMFSSNSICFRSVLNRFRVHDLKIELWFLKPSLKSEKKFSWNSKNVWTDEIQLSLDIDGLELFWFRDNSRVKPSETIKIWLLFIILSKPGNFY